MQYQHPVFQRITVDPEVCFGKPCIRGLRMPVGSILQYLAGGMSVETLLGEFPFLEEDDVKEALAFSAEMLSENLVPLKRAS